MGFFIFNKFIMTDKKRNRIISQILKLELIVTEAFFKGHKASDNDEYQKYRDELKKLRKKIGIL